MAQFESSDEERCCCNGDSNSIWWREPPKDSLLVSYLRENSMHGLKYVAEPRRHLSERICWLTAFLVAAAAAAYLINAVWDNYRRTPVIVSFQPTESNIGDVPFPAVTLCNMNRFPKQFYEEALRKSKLEVFDEASWKVRENAREDLHYLNSICRTQDSFAQMFGYAKNRGFVTVSDDTENVLNATDTTLDLMSLLIEETLPCDQQIRLCLWAQKEYPCSELFKPIVTEFGKCCTFNILPVPLLLTKDTITRYNESEGAVSSRTAEPIKPRWNQSEIDMWSEWDFDQGFLLPNSKLERPYRQTRAGLPYGLSILVDPNLDQYFCPSTDAEGFRLVLHTAVENPPVDSLGFPIGLGKEIYLDVRVDLTLADSVVASFPHDKRSCFFQTEKSLKFFKAYTNINCMDECIANLTARICGCTLFYMPRGESTRICSPEHDSIDHQCTQGAQRNFTRNYADLCKNCDSLCTDIFYHFESTQADLQSSDILWETANGSRPEWAKNKMSILHIYYGMDSFVPQVRNQLYAQVDLIANTGGLLGLCLGFSALSAVEFVYFFTLRWIWRRVRRRALGQMIANKFVDALKRVGQHERFGNFQGGMNQVRRPAFPLVGDNILISRRDGRHDDPINDNPILPVYYPSYGIRTQGFGRHGRLQRHPY